MPHGKSHELIHIISEKNPKLKIIDLSADFRFDDIDTFEKTYQLKHQSKLINDQFVYGNCEINTDKITKASYVAVPGCFPTSVILAVYPIKQLVTGLIKVDAKTGVSGAGKTPKESNLFCEVNETVLAYNAGIHRHGPEMEEKLGHKVHFSPHLVPVQRGIISSVFLQLKDDISENELFQMFETFYEQHEQVVVKPWRSQISTKDVLNTNYTSISVTKIAPNELHIISCIDNLIKGAAGQAIQAMNVMFGYDQYVGLS